ncbi:Uncharacterised protein [BD1-7 clade bacterium]|uniref:Peptidase M14 carboxypeptidase A domain-containing protein n=1 Tax=BD1-7 clade bacterium TaxID=2029982 RepID=A0A5S9QHM4_9GAMM|nr:Uncharacterised protein [BD1-7 clade bacterium]
MTSPSSLGRFLAVFVLGFWIAACSDSDDSNGQGKADVSITSNFESGNIGRAERAGDAEWDLYLKDDNNDASLPVNWRNWWYVRIRQQGEAQTLTLNLKNRGWNYFYVPVYSYDRLNWFRLDESDVKQVGSSETCNSTTQSPVLDDCELSMRLDASLFDGRPLYLARFYPYTYSQLLTFLKTLEGHECVDQSSVGRTAVFQESIPYLTIRCPDGDDSQVVWIHGRTHPAESGSSFVLEGAITRLLGDMEENRNNSRNLAVYIVPMHNVDGVIAGNYRTTPDSLNLEVLWTFDQASLPFLKSDAPLENRLVNEPMRTVSQMFADRSLIALNLHSSNSAPDRPVFAFPHFGDDPDQYTAEEIQLWNDSNRLLNLLKVNYDGRIDTTATGGDGFLNAFFPETWWWRTRAETAVAMTVETTYGRAGFPHWVTETNIRELGSSLIQSIYDYRDGVVPETPINLLRSDGQAEPVFAPMDEWDTKH